jgi:hypothetical protein
MDRGVGKNEGRTGGCVDYTFGLSPTICEEAIDKTLYSILSTDFSAFFITNRRWEEEDGKIRS